MKKFHWDNDQSQALASIAEAFSNHEVALVPTETVYGLMCLYQDAEAEEKIFKIKERDSSKLLQVLISNTKQLASLDVQSFPALEALADAFWPGPMTIILEDSEGRTHGARIPDHPVPLAIIDHLNKPLAATSANLSGQDPALTFQQALDEIPSLPAIGIDSGACEIQSSSTVLKLSENSFTILREGPISEQDIREKISTYLKE